MRLALATATALAAVLACAPAAAQDGAMETDELLGEGWRLYSEDLEFERASEAFAQAADHPGATEAQRLEALEYLAACYHALGNEQATREALRRLLAIDPQAELHDPSHPPELLAMIETLRAEAQAEQAEEQPEPDLGVTTFDGGGSAGDEVGAGASGEGTSLEDYYPDQPRRPWYRTWWFWTITGAVVAAGVTTAIVLSVPSGEALPPEGSLEPGRVDLPCAGIRF